MEAESTILALSVFLMLNYLDFLTTRAGLLVGGREGNPIAKRILDRYGFTGLFAFKFGLMSLLPLYVLLRGADVEQTLWVWNIVLSLVVAWNSLQVFLKRKN